MNKKTRILIAVLIAVAAAGTALYFYLNNSTHLFEKMFAKEVKENQAEDISFHYTDEDVLSLKTRYFVPEESGEYLFTVSDIKTDDNAAVGLYVANHDFTEYVVADNYIPGDEIKEMGDSTYLQKGEKCYILLVIIPIEDDAQIDPFDGSFSLLVSKKPEYTEPPLLTEEEDATLTIKADDRACVRFTPKETGYFRFDTSIVSADASSGFSDVSSIISPDNLKTQITEGIAHLETGKEYYVWVTVHETGDADSEVLVSVNPMALLQISGPSEVTLTEDTMIEYHAEDKGYMAVYSASDGNPNAIIYEKAGFAIRTDEDGENSLSGNDKDFAMVFSQKAGTNYCIGVYGDLGSECKVTIVPYIGDGSSLTLDDINQSVLEKLEAEAAESEQEGIPEPGTDGAEAEEEEQGTDAGENSANN